LGWCAKRSCLHPDQKRSHGHYPDGPCYQINDALHGNVLRSYIIRHTDHHHSPN